MRTFLITIFILLVTAPCITCQEFVISRSLTYADGSSGFSRVKPGDTVWIQSGNRDWLKIANFHGQPGKPVVFVNLDGQVILDTDKSYGLSFAGCSFIKLSGQQGPGYIFGFRVQRASSSNGIGISAGEKSTDFEIENCEVTNVGFAGIMAKTEPTCDDPGTYRNAFTQYNTSIHDCYVHDVTGEGLYVGHSFYSGFYLAECNSTIFPSVLIGTQIYNNRIERTGWDGIQVSSAIRDCEIHDNELIDCSYLMENSQMSGIIIGGGTQAKCFNNKIIDGYATGILVFGKGGTEVYNNLIVRPGKRNMPNDPGLREHGIYLSDKTGDEKTYYGVYNNTIFQPKSDGIRIDNTVNFDVRIFNNAIIDPGAYIQYENDNTDRTGFDSYIFDTGKSGLYHSSNNFFSQSSDPAGFANVAGNNFRLQPGSPMIDAGLNLLYAGVIIDLDGRSRPVGAEFDIGAYEYSASQSIGENDPGPDFTVSSIQIDPGKTLVLNLIGSRDMIVNLCLIDLLGRVVCEQQNLAVGVGNNKLALPANTGKMLILIIRSDRLTYARKIVRL